jgi:hypothetical protein
MGPALALQRAVMKDAEEQGYAFLFGLPNRQSMPIVRRLGFSTLGYLSSFTRLVRSARKISQISKSARLGAIMGPLIDVGIDAAGAVVSIGGRMHGVTPSVPVSFGEEFDRLNDRLSRRIPLLGDRHSRFLNWRFLECPYASYEIFSITDAESDVRGYIVHHFVGDRVVIDDLLCEQRLLDTLLREFVQHQRKMHREAISLSCLAPARLESALKRHGFVLRDRETQPIVLWVPESSPVSEVVNDPNSWWFFRADNDV